MIDFLDVLNFLFLSNNSSILFLSSAKKLLYPELVFVYALFSFQLFIESTLCRNEVNFSLSYDFFTSYFNGIIILLS